MFRLRRSRRESGAGTAVAEPSRAEEFDGTTDELLAEIQRLGEANRSDQDAATERRLLTLRHLAGIRLLDAAPPDPEHPAPAFERLPEADGLPDIARADLTPELLRAGDVQGATIERGVSIGTGAKVIGAVRIGAGATVGANAVVVDDVPAGATVVGAPARVV